MRTSADQAPQIPGVLLIMSQTDYRSNGGAISATELAIEATRRGVDVTVVTSHESVLTDRLRSNGIDIQIIDILRHNGERMLGRPVQTIRGMVHMTGIVLRQLRSGRFGVVQTNDRRAFWYSWLGALLSGRPILDVVRGTQPQSGRVRKVKWCLEFGIASRVMVLSGDMVTRWSGTLGADPKQFYPVHSIVDLLRFRPARSEEEVMCLRRGLGVDASEQVVLYPAGFRPMKQQLSFIRRCLPKILEMHEDSRIYFLGDFDPVGDPYCAECLRQVEELGLADRVAFLGHRTDMEEWYRIADVTVLGSKKEGLSRCMIESIASGTPVVSFDVASAREILEGHSCGLVVSSQDYEALAAEINALLSDRELRSRFSRSGRRAAEELFASENVVGEYVSLLRTLAGDREA